MPKDEFDPEDPMELRGVGLWTEEDTSAAMADCFVEEFLRLGWNHKQILALFRNPHYLGMNLVFAHKGEAFVKEIIAEVFARWGRSVEWPSPMEAHSKTVSGSSESRPSPEEAENRDSLEACSTLTDPMGGPVPDLTI
jgi:hypothetical protein